MNQRRKQQEQWKLVEHVVASLFDDSDVDVQSNVRLPAIRRVGSTSGRREIDVLVTGRVAGQRIYVPIECKHLRKKVGSPEIDAFIGKLLDVGLPTQTSIFVSTSGFTKSGIARAEKVGMRTLALSGANLDKTRELILEAIQSHVYVACHLAKLQFESLGELDDQGLLFFGRDGQYKGTLADFLWQAWVSGTPPLRCGKYAYRVEIPEEWLFSLDGSPKQIRDIRVEYEVFALVREYQGQVSWHRLIDASSGALERQTVQFTFSGSRGVQVPRQFDSESELRSYLSSREVSARLSIGRLRLPKLAMHQGLLWPVPGEVVERFGDLAPDVRSAELEQFRESAANSFWDFDDAYASVLREAQAGSWIRLQEIE